MNFLSIALILLTSFPQTPSSWTTGDYCAPNNPDFYEYRYVEQIPVCKRNVSYATKTKIYNRYDINESVRKEYTIDHLIPLSLGGSNDESNLWPQHRSISSSAIEFRLFKDVSDGKTTQQKAIKELMDFKFKRNKEVIQ
jgi:hypothetical protein